VLCYTLGRKGCWKRVLTSGNNVGIADQGGVLLAGSSDVGGTLGGGLDIATYPIQGGKVQLPTTQGTAYITATSEKNATL
jgi:hypothetical protein